MKIKRKVKMSKSAKLKIFQIAYIDTVKPGTKEARKDCSSVPHSLDLIVANTISNVRND